MAINTNEIFTISVVTHRGIIDLKFKDLARFVKVAGFQLGILFGVIEEATDYCNIVGENLSRRWKEKEDLGLFDLPDESMILDIGSGVGLFDIILSQYLNNKATFYLVDKGNEEDSKKVIQWGTDHGFYNDWDVLQDLISHSNVYPEQFNTLTPEDPWPETLDMIMSSNSYLWHYPLECYWERVLPHAQKGCSLGFDILYREEFDAASFITRTLGQPPVSLARPTPKFHWHEEDLYIQEGSYGQICCWNVQK